jgi:hemolysin-activating ACP:hemolysin acyltransferase
MTTELTKSSLNDNAAGKPSLRAAEHPSTGNGVEADAVMPKERTLDPAVVAQIKTFRARLRAGAGEVVLAMAGLPRYRNQTFADITHLVIEPMLNNRVAIAKSANEGKFGATAGIAIWASVSEEVDARIREQIQARVFPIRLKPEDWNSGDIHWLLDLIAPSQNAATAALANFKQVVKDKPIRIHPIINQLVDATVLDKMRVKPGVESQGQANDRKP